MKILFSFEMTLLNKTFLINKHSLLIVLSLFHAALAIFIWTIDCIKLLSNIVFYLMQSLNCFYGKLLHQIVVTLEDQKNNDLHYSTNLS